MHSDTPDQETYISEAIEAAATALLWQAPDATEDGNGFPLTDRNGKLEGETRYVTRVVTEVPYLTEAVTAFVRDSWDLLQRGSVTASQAGHDLILTANRHGAGFNAEFALDDDGNVAWLMVENTVLADELGWSADSAPEGA